MKQFVIITAGGKGQRMKSAVPKQFLTIGNEVVLMKTIAVFYSFDPTIKIILTLPKDHIDYWKELCAKHNFKIIHSIVNGGSTRFHSIQNALELISAEGLVAIHDGVRPLVSQNTIQQTFEIASINGNAVPYIDMFDSVRYVDDTANHPVDRNKYKLIQTPQVFECSIIKKAYQQPWDKSFTDDASVVEKMGVKINLIPGNRENIKITSQTDLKFAEILDSYFPA